MFFWIIYLLLFVFFLCTINIKFSKSLIMKSMFSKSNTNLAQLFICICLCVIVGMHLYEKSFEGMSPSSGPSSGPSATCKKGCETTCNKMTDCTSQSTCQEKYPNITVGAFDDGKTTTGYNKCDVGCDEQYIRACEIDSYRLSDSTKSDSDTEASKNQVQTAQDEYKEGEAKLKSETQLDIFKNAGITQPGGYPVYYKPGTFVYPGSGFYPNYSEVSANRQANIGNRIEPKTINSPYILGGFCQYNKNFPNKIEEKCKELPPDVCSSTDCCVLLNGTNCVSGNEYGATNKTNYSDFIMGDVEYWYYKGKCYGNCPT